MIPKKPIRSLLLWLALSALMVLAGCGRSRGPRISITWNTPKPDVGLGTPLIYRAIQIGEVTQVDPSAHGFVIHANLYPKHAHYVTDRCTFFVERATRSEPPHIKLRPLSDGGTPAMDGAIFAGSESQMEAGVQALTTDWLRTSVLTGVVLAVVFTLIYLTKGLLRIGSLIICGVAGVVSAGIFWAHLEQALRDFLPPDLRTDLVARAVAFLGGYLLAAALLGLLKRPQRT